METRAVYPGTFDPLTYGHIDILKRSLKLIDHVTILLAKNIQKKTFFTLPERLDQLEEILKKENILDRVKIDCFQGLLVDYCKRNSINVIIRGLRPLVDFEYEFEMAMANRDLNRSVETVFIITDHNFFYLRSSLIKEIIKMGGDVSDKVPPLIEKALKLKIVQSE